MRVIAGQYRSRLLKSLKGLALRPTSDYLRETLFNVLGPEIAGSRFIDLFAGTGAVGIEALSRGAVKVVFIENHAPAAALIRKNLESLGIRAGTRVSGFALANPESAIVLSADALRGLQTLATHRSPHAQFDYVFLDPPYANADDYLRVLRYLASAEFLSPNAIVIAERRHTFSLPDEINALHRIRLLKQGDAALTFYRRTPDASS
jgi:16S rRNA (guanine966-N2)-methyltransferase